MIKNVCDEYSYDLFLSYPRCSPYIKKWVNNHFFPLFTVFLDNSFSRPIKIFKDDLECAPDPQARPALAISPPNSELGQFSILLLLSMLGASL